eukprot:scaffold98257_cov63-Phaeocystis_antarctica.AAC.3
MPQGRRARVGIKAAPGRDSAARNAGASTPAAASAARCWRIKASAGASRWSEAACATSCTPAIAPSAATAPSSTGCGPVCSAHNGAPRARCATRSSAAANCTGAVSQFSQWVASTEVSSATLVAETNTTLVAETKWHVDVAYAFGGLLRSGLGLGLAHGESAECGGRAVERVVPWVRGVELGGALVEREPLGGVALTSTQADAHAS